MNTDDLQRELLELRATVSSDLALLHRRLDGIAQQVDTDAIHLRVHEVESGFMNQAALLGQQLEKAVQRVERTEQRLDGLELRLSITEDKLDG